MPPAPPLRVACSPGRGLASFRRRKRRRVCDDADRGATLGDSSPSHHTHTNFPAPPQRHPHRRPPGLALALICHLIRFCSCDCSEAGQWSSPPATAAGGATAADGKNPVMMMSFIVLSETKLCLPPYTCLGSVFATNTRGVCPGALSLVLPGAQMSLTSSPGNVVRAQRFTGFARRYWRPRSPCRYSIRGCFRKCWRPRNPCLLSSE